MDMHGVLFLDGQAGGATPAHGDLLELAWAQGSGPVTARNIVPVRPVSAMVRKLTGWSETMLATSVDPLAAWSELVGMLGPGPVPAVIHYARFELPFLQELHARVAPDALFPLDVVCLHAIATRLYPDLPRRSLRALSGFLGHSPEPLRRAAGHVEATAFVWRAILPGLAKLGSWSDLKSWLAEPRDTPRTRKRVFPMAVEKRRALPEQPGIYRFHRSNGDVLYVGKAASLRKRVNGHFVAARRGTERALEMLTQASDVSFVIAETALEAALFEADEIKRCDPPYNVHLREHARAPHFASHDWLRVSPAPDGEHPLGPFPSAQAIAGIAALRRHLHGAPLDDELRAAIVGVSSRFAPPAELFDPVLATFVTRELAGRPARAIVAAGARLTTPDADPTTEGWDAGRIERAIVRTVVDESRLLQRARAMALLADAAVTFREPGTATARTLHLANARFANASAPAPRLRRLASLATAASYDRVRVLLTELGRISREGGDVRVTVGTHHMRK